MPTETTFDNPENQPLDKLYFSVISDDGTERKIPALDKTWAPRALFANYISLIHSVCHIKNGVELEEWKYQAECFKEDMEYLLSLRHHEFWSCMIYQKSALAAIVSFLQKATPFYVDISIQNPPPPYVIELYETILSLVLRIICRLITNKESPSTWLTKEHMQNLIYSNFLVSVPMLFDLIVAVGDADPHNTNLLRRIFETLLQIVPKYKDDLGAALTFFQTAFYSIQTQTDNEGFEGAGGGILDEGVDTPYDDVALYTLDCAYSLRVLLDVCPELFPLCIELKLPINIARFYDDTIPFLYKNIYFINEYAVSLDWINQARIQLLMAFHILANFHMEGVKAESEDSITHGENYVALLTECLSEQMFVIDYERQYQVMDNIDIIKQICRDIDFVKLTFIGNAYSLEAKAVHFGAISNVSHNVERQEAENQNDELNKPLVNGHSESVNDVREPRDIDIEVTAVLDVLPHLGTGFIRRILSRYENSEEAITAILENNLPPDLIEADQKEVCIPPDPQDRLMLETGVQHFNIHDGDDYDVLSTDNPKCIIKRGKGFPNALNATQVLDDKSELKKFRHLYEEYTLVSDTEENGEYNDEYDDSYDALLESETKVIKSKEFKASLANIEDISENETTEDTDEEGNEADESCKDYKNVGNKSMNFCENPENVRARYEARRQSKGVRRGATSTYNTNNVVGVPKGHGQEHDVLRNRHKKEVNKSSRANHNRKASAAYKRNKGMLG